MLPEEIEKLNQQLDRIWNAIYQIQCDVNNIQAPTHSPRAQPSLERTSRQMTLEEFNQPRLKQWTEVQWEQWATDIYTNYPQVAQYLPDWFLAKMQKK